MAKIPLRTNMNILNSSSNPPTNPLTLKNEKISNLLLRLVNAQLAQSQGNVAPSQGKILQIFTFCLRLLSSRLSPSVNVAASKDLHLLADLIKKKFIRCSVSAESSISTSINLAQLLTQLIRHAQNLRNCWSVLYFFYSLSFSSVESCSSLYASSDLTFNVAPSSLVADSHVAPSLVADSRSSFSLSLNTPIHASSVSGMATPVNASSVALPLPNTVGKRIPTIAPVLEELSILKLVLYAYQLADSDQIAFKNNAYSSTSIQNPLLPSLLLPATLYRRITASIPSSNHQNGLLLQCLYSLISQDLNLYHSFCADFEQRLTASPCSLTMLKLLHLLQPISVRLSWIQHLLQQIAGVKSGGKLLSIVYECSQHGDPQVSQIFTSYLDALCKVYLQMLTRWIHSGILQDPFHEFFILSSASSSSSVTSNLLWKGKFYIADSEHIPCFIPEKLINDAFTLGKSIDFLRVACNERISLASFNDDSSSYKQHEYGYCDLVELERRVAIECGVVSKHVMNVLREKYLLMQHFGAIKKYLLMSQGEFIQNLLDCISPELEKSAAALYRHHLTSTMATAIRSSNAQFEPPSVLKRLDVRLLESSSDSDLGWDVFSLEYHVADAPLSVVFGEEVMICYLRLFNFLWRLKRVRHVLAGAWQRSLQIRHLQYSKGASVHPTIRKMTHFMNEMESFVFNALIEKSCAEFQAALKDNDTLDGFITLHTAYCEKLCRDIFAKGDKVGSMKDDGLLAILLMLFRAVVAYCHEQESLCDLLTAKSEQEKKVTLDMAARQKSGTWSVTTGTQLEQAKQKAASDALIEKSSVKLKLIADEFQLGVVSYLDRLNACEDEGLQSLGLRLDFNDFYRGGDASGAASYGISASNSQLFV